MIKGPQTFVKDPKGTYDMQIRVTITDLFKTSIGDIAIIDFRPI